VWIYFPSETLSPGNITMDRYDDLRGAQCLDAFCKTYDVGKSKVYEEIKAGRLRAVKFGAKTLILKRDAEAWANSLPSLVPAK
jgi:excisionase family DNA binding protein